MNRCRAGAARAAVHRSLWEELNPPIPTYGEHVPDGSGIELVRSPQIGSESSPAS
jgi:hypothetical protein